MKLFSDYIECRAEALLGAHPFQEWEVVKSIESDLKEPIVQYIFPNKGLELRCDANNIITSIFIKDKNDPHVNSHMNITFSSSRSKLISRFGPPQDNGEEMNHPILGIYGAWDKFKFPGFSIHVEYQPGNERIKQITFMR